MLVDKARREEVVHVNEELLLAGVFTFASPVVPYILNFFRNG